MRPWHGGKIFVGDGEEALPEQLTSGILSSASMGSTPADTRGMPDVILLACPTCGGLAEGTREAFNLSTLDRRTWCKQCRCSRFVRLWRCPCGVLWHACPLHAGEPDRLRAKHATRLKRPLPSGQRDSPRAKRASTRQDRYVEPTSVIAGSAHVQGNLRAPSRSRRVSEWFDAPPPKRHSAGGIVCFRGKEAEEIFARGVNPRLLSPNLKRKFAHLCTYV